MRESDGFSGGFSDGHFQRRRNLSDAPQPQDAWESSSPAPVVAATEEQIEQPAPLTAGGAALDPEPFAKMNTDELHRVLQEKMSAVLRTHKTLSSSRSRHESAGHLTKLKTDEFEALSVPILVVDEFVRTDATDPKGIVMRPEEEQALRSFLEEAERVITEFNETIRAQFRASLGTEWACWDHACAAEELRLVLEAVSSAKPELSNDDMVLAARHMLSKSECFVVIKATVPSGKSAESAPSAQDSDQAALDDLAFVQDLAKHKEQVMSGSDKALKQRMTPIFESIDRISKRLEQQPKGSLSQLAESLDSTGAKLAGEHHTQDWLLPRKPDITLEELGEYPAYELDSDHREGLEKLRHAVLDAALQVSAALTLDKLSLDSAAKVEELKEPTGIMKPVRPMEEEVRRYLTQLNEFTTRRQKAHRTLSLLWFPQAEARRNVAAALDKLNQTFGDRKQALIVHLEPKPASPRVSEQLILMPDGGSAVFAAVRDCAELVKVYLRSIQSLDWAKDVVDPARQKPWLHNWELDVQDVTTPSTADVEDLAKIKELQWKLGFAMGRLSEADCNCEAAKKTPTAAVGLEGIVVNQTWQECLEWSEQRKKEQLRATQSNLSRQATIELLQTEVNSAKEDLEDCMSELRRYIRTRLAVGPTDVPCNELRALMDASAWMSKSDVEVTGLKAKLRVDLPYPVFPR